MIAKKYSDILLERLFLMPKEEIPVVALLLCDATGEIICIKENATIKNSDPFAHAEMEIFTHCIKNKIFNLIGYTLITTLEPCIMCYGAAKNMNISTIVFLSLSKDNGAISYYGIIEGAPILIPYLRYQETVKEIIKKFFKSLR